MYQAVILTLTLGNSAGQSLNPTPGADLLGRQQCICPQMPCFDKIEAKQSIIYPWDSKSCPIDGHLGLQALSPSDHKWCYQTPNFIGISDKWFSDKLSWPISMTNPSGFPTSVALILSFFWPLSGISADSWLHMVRIPSWFSHFVSWRWYWFRWLGLAASWPAKLSRWDPRTKSEQPSAEDSEFHQSAPVNFTR